MGVPRGERIRSTGGKGGSDWGKKHHLDFAGPQCGKEMSASLEDYAG